MHNTYVYLIRHNHWNDVSIVKKVLILCYCMYFVNFSITPPQKKENHKYFNNHIIIVAFSDDGL